MHSNARMQYMRTTIELSDRTYALLRAKAAERGMRGFSALVEEALSAYLVGPGDERAAALAEAEGAWGADDVAEWERARKEVWASWSRDRSWTPTS